jgi:hypothetical protein
MAKKKEPKFRHAAGDQLKKKMGLLNEREIVRTSINPNKKHQQGDELNARKAKKQSLWFLAFCNVFQPIFYKIISIICIKIICNN